MKIDYNSWSIRHSRIFISSPPHRVGERLLLFKLKGKGAGGRPGQVWTPHRISVLEERGLYPCSAPKSALGERVCSPY
ncbi:hypothetical protein FJR11_22015 [Anabaena sp. UHCC 0187]|nr:hypothetical protein [Anabaena sp. UHCC 0187]